MKQYTLIFLFFLACAGCEEDVISILGTERPFTMYSVLNPQCDTQFVRIFPIEGVLEVNEPTPLAAVFSGTNLTTGEPIVWADSLVRDASGYGYIYWAPFRAEYEHTYHLQITGEDGRQSSATVEVGAPSLTFDVTIPVSFAGPIPQLIVSDLSFFTQYTVALTSTGVRIIESDTVRVESNHQIRKTDAGISLSINLSDAAQESKIKAGIDADYDPRFGVELRYIRLLLIVANEAWDPPDGVFDPFVLIQPDVMSNVENGFGFVGAGYEVEIRWQPTPVTMRTAGFSYFD